MEPFAARRSTVARVLAVALASALAVAMLPKGGLAAADATEAPEGQVVLLMDATAGRHHSRTASFASPNGHAVLRADGTPDARTVIRVNGEDVSAAIAALARGMPAVVDISSLVQAGENLLEVRFVRGSGFVSIDYPTLVRVDPAAAGFDAAAFEALDAFVASRAGTGLSTPTRLYAGAVVLVAYRGQIVHESAIGHAQTYEGTEPLADPREMTTDTIFDLASVTKVAATTAGVLKLVDEGVLSLDDALGEYIPELGADKAPITLRQMLTHRSGLWEWQPTYLHGRNQAAVLEFLAGVPLRYGIDTGRHYSDIGGGMLPGVMIERATGQRLDDYLRTEIHEPLGMTDTGFTPDANLRSRIAATSFGNPYEYRMIETGNPYPVADTGRADDFDGWRDYTLVGEVNDGNSWYGWEGVSGHAGLFSTARDLAVYGQMLNNGGGYADVKVASANTLDTFLAEPSDSGQAIGFWSRRLPGTSGLPVSERGFGHGGFTGTEFLFDPSRDLVVVLLTNRQHPGEPYRGISSVWSGVLQRVMAALPAG
jgi:CubicO group peptidase (beta-lactamase class C family)